MSTGEATTSGRVRRTLGRLHDGREIIYYDDTAPYVDGEATRELHDPRPPAEPSRAGQMRYDPLSGSWVTIAAHRPLGDPGGRLRRRRLREQVTELLAARPRRSARGDAARR